MSAKTRFYKSSFLVSLLLFFLCLQPLFSANVLGRPRKMFLIKTEHFDIIYSEESRESALLLVENAEALYDKASASLDKLGETAGFEKLGSQNNLHMPVIISPDSDLLSVEYTPSPYNRIIIFDSPASEAQAVFEDTMLGLFYREIYKALSQSIRSPFNQFVAKWIAGEAYQPVALFYLPYSFIEGAAYLVEGDAGAEFDFESESESEEEKSQGRMKDGYFLQILSQAKLEGKFPNWFQVTTVRDIYPGEELVYAAGAGFAAFLMNEYGVEKYAELWQESGKNHPFLTQGVFYTVYEKTLFELWKEFENQIPLPQDLELVNSFEDMSEPVFPDDPEANYEHLLLTNYGIVWYDRIRHEVDIYDEKGLLKIRQLLFLADNVERMTASEDGRYISVSHTRARTMEDLSSSSTWIYDLKERKFLDAKYSLRDAAIILTEDGQYAVAGVNVKNSLPVLEVYSMPLDDKENLPVLLFEKKFERNKIPFSPVYSGRGCLSYILADGTERLFCRLSIGETSEKKWLILRSSEAGGQDSSLTPLKIRRLAFNPGRGGSGPFYSFAFTLPEINSFTRAGFIYIDGNFEPQSLQLTAADFSGGINFPAVSYNKTLLYSARKFSVNQLRRVALPAVPMEAGVLREVDAVAAGLAGGEGGDSGEAESSSLSAWNVKRYNPLRYMTDFSFTPFFPIKDIDMSEGNLYWPGLGLTVESQTDPCMNTQAVLSAGWTYLPMDFSWTSNIPSSYLAKIRSESLNLSKDKSAAFYIENSSTPVYIKAGTLFNFNLDGEYNFKLAAGGQWKLPVGIALRNLTFDLQASYEVSTDYYDQTQNDIRPSLSDWPSFSSAYEMYEVSVKVEYSNIHQYGYSSFEQRGLSIGTRAYSMWDMYEVKLLRQARKEKEEKEKAEKLAAQENGSKDKDPKETLTNAQKKNLFSESIADITQLNAGLFATVAIPRLTPLTSKNGWVLSVPARVTAEFMNKAGTALGTRSQVLLIGREIHNNIIPAFLFCRRAGLWLGYDMGLVYDTTEVRLPDIRHEDYLIEIFSDVSYTQAFFMVLNLDLNITSGKLSTVPINTTLTATFFPESHGYDISLDVRLHL